MSSNSQHAVLVFDATQSGPALPVRALGGSVATFGSPTAIASSLATNELFVVKRGGRTDAYPLSAAGDVAPTRSLISPIPVGISWALAFDDISGEVSTVDYRAANLGGRVIVLNALSGALTRLINGEDTQLGFPASLVIDRSHSEFLVGVTGDADPNRQFPRIVAFNTTGGGNMSPTRVLGSATSTNVGGWEVTRDRGRDQILTSCNCDNRITVFDRTATGDASPVRTIVLPPSVLSVYALLPNEAADTLWVAARVAPPGGTGEAETYALMEIPRAANGNVAPLRPPIELNTVGRLAPCN
ncbi:MAG: hypothetical protein ABUR63_04595 [Verrucomicrobiota bacterium]